MALLRGQVLDDVTGTPVNEFALGRFDDSEGTSIRNSTKQTFEALDGRFEYRVGMHWRSEEFRVVAKATGYAGGRSRLIHAVAGERVEGLEIRMIRGATVNGRVRTATGLAVANAVITIEPPPLPPGCYDYLDWPNQSRVVAEVMTDAAGSFSVPQLLPARYVAISRHPDFGPQLSEPFAVPPAGELKLREIVLDRGGRIRGRVKRQDGQPDTRAFVSIVPVVPTNGPDKHRSAWTNSLGRFEITGLAAGEYNLRVTTRDGKPDLSSPFATEPTLRIALKAEEVKELEL